MVESTAIAGIKCGQIFLSNNKFSLICKFCGSDFLTLDDFRTHLNEHFSDSQAYIKNEDSRFNTESILWTPARKSAKETANHKAPTTETDLLSIKIELPNDSDTLNHFDHFINSLTIPSDEKLESSVRPTIEEQILNMKQANVVLDRMVVTDIVQDYKHGAKPKVHSKKPEVGASVTFPTEPVNCAFCNEIISNLFPTAKEIRDEFKRTAQVECRMCGLSIEQLVAVPIHYNRVHINKNGKLKSLVACNACVAQKAKGQQLQFSNSDPTSIKCELCSRMNRNQTSYQNHLRNFHKDRSVHTCAHCDVLFIGRSRYTKHVYTHHSPKFKPARSDKEYRCDRCGKVFKARSSILNHLHSHYAQKRFQCTLCPLTLRTAVSLSNHMQIHSGLKNATCDVCGRGFVDKSNLNDHMLSHSGEQPFPCQECGKRFSRKSNMVKHLRTHRSAKPFACDQCDKRYRDSTDLRRHKRIHGGSEKTQICTICDTRYYEAKYLRAHLKSAHNIVVATPKF